VIQKAGAIRRYHSWLTLGHRLLDATVVFALLPILCVARGIHYDQSCQIAAIFGAVLTWIAMGAMDAYRPWRGARLWQEARVLIGGWLLVVCGLIFTAWVTKSTGIYSRIVIGGWFVSAPLALIAVHFIQRLFLRVLRKSGHNTRTVVIIGAGDLGCQLAKRFQQEKWMGIRIIGCFDDDPRKTGKSVGGLPVLGKCLDVYDYVREHGVDKVYLTLPMRAEKRMREVFDLLQDTTASVFLVPDLFVFELMGAREQDIGGMPVFSLCESPLTGPFGVFKRMEDVVLAGLILIIVSPLMVLIALGVKLTSPGPVLFRQRRYGLAGRNIRVWKFRTMTVCEDGEEFHQATRCDPRVTPIGAFLRRTSLDELPQFFNVLQGTMSVVGPRPHAVAHNEQYRKLIKGYMWRHKVKPGITGWAQINGWRGETDTLEKMQKRVEYDLDYIRNWSLWLDIKIVLLTIIRGFTGKNAY